ncbi:MULTISPECIES: hypothetical protein [Mesorhizobium]|uniref:hypothetical protein n=1 Tax=Mesorhizobium TaxID=68287 RepID=UPI0010A96817|nr:MULTISPECIES: hypothetical protein [Mesorhizobium]
MDPAFNAADKDVLGASDSMKVSFIGVPIRVDANVVGTPTIDRATDSVFSRRRGRADRATRCRNWADDARQAGD